MNVHPMMHEVLRVSDAMVGESSFPDFDRVSQSFFHCVRVAAFDELQREIGPRRGDCARVAIKSSPQRLKPRFIAAFTARVNSCPSRSCSNHGPFVLFPFVTMLEFFLAAKSCGSRFAALEIMPLILDEVCEREHNMFVRLAGCLAIRSSKGVVVTRA